VKHDVSLSDERRDQIPVPDIAADEPDVPFDFTDVKGVPPVRLETGIEEGDLRAETDATVRKAASDEAQPAGDQDASAFEPVIGK